MAQERKAAKPNADSIARSKKIWERLRRQSHVPLEERKQLVAELFDIITGKVKDFVLKHDAGRVVQTGLKYGNLEQRKIVARELKGEYRSLAEGKFAKHTIGKVLVHGDDEIRDIVVPEFCGNVRRMIKHPEAAWILDDVYRGAATPKQKAILLREWYGAEYAIFKASPEKNESADLAALLSAKPEKRAPTMRYLFDLINQLIQKNTTGFTMLHDAMLQYYLNTPAGSEEAQEFVELLKGDESGDLLKNLAFTKSGARVVCLALARSNAKDRKHLLKVYKGIMPTLAYDGHGHQVLLASLYVIDDTVLTSKSIYSELIPTNTKPDVDTLNNNLLEAISHIQARTVVLFPFAANLKSILPTTDLPLIKELHPIRSTTSKKDPGTRCQELARSISPPLLALIAARAADLVQSSFGCIFITEVLLGTEADKQPALQSIVTLLGMENMRASLSTPAAGRMLKALVLGGRFDFETKELVLCEPPLQFADMLYAATEREIVEWAKGANSFVVVGLLESKDFSGKDNLLQKLREQRKQLEQVVGNNEDGEPKVKKQKRVEGGEGIEESKGGNKGTRLLLRLLDG